MRRKDIGAFGEKLAGEYLKKRGYRILETNYRSPDGEVDIIAKEGEYLVFVEVRTKRGRSFGTPQESITQAKAERLIKVAYYYQQTNQNLPQLWRIDVVSVDLGGRSPQIELIKNAIGEHPFNPPPFLC